MDMITYFLIALSTSVVGSFLGIGGGVILLPILLLMGVSQGTAAFSSALTVFTMAIFTCSIYYKRKQGNVGLALKIAVTSIPTTFLGAMVNQMLPEAVYRFLYGALIVVLLGIMIWKKKRHNEKPHFLSEYRIIPYVFGVIIGFLAGLFGIGGGNCHTNFAINFHVESKNSISDIQLCDITDVPCKYRFLCNHWWK